MISGAELLTGHSSSSFDSILAAYSDWGAVHGPSTSYTRMALSLSDLISGKALSQEQPARPGNKRARSECWVPLLTNRPPLAAAAVATGWPPILAAAVAASAAILPAVAAPDPAASLRASRLTAVAISGID